MEQISTRQPKFKKRSSLLSALKLTIRNEGLISLDV